MSDRKAHVRVAQHYYLDMLIDCGPMTLGDIAMTFNVHETTARHKLDGLISQGKVVRRTDLLQGLRVPVYAAVEEGSNA